MVKNNYWEEMDMNKFVGVYHEAEMQKMDLPDWIIDIVCPFCHSRIPLRSIRNISLCLNTRNYGEVSVEVLCDLCSQMDTVYFREGIINIKEFADLLVDARRIKTEPILEEEMYKRQYNNIVEKIVNGKGLLKI